MSFLYNPGLSDADIQGLEQRLKKSLPSDYRDFLKKRNGIYLTAPDYVSLPLDKVDEGRIAFDRLFGLMPDEASSDLLAFNEEFINELSFLGSSIAIGEDGGGNPFVWVAEAGKEGLYYWDRTHLHGNNDKNGFDIAEHDGCGNLFFLAPDFKTFFELIISAGYCDRTAQNINFLDMVDEKIFVMVENTFSTTEMAITSTDIDTLELAIGYKVPRPFRTHYLKYNGGSPQRTYWFSDTFEEPLEIATFKPISKAGEANASSILSTYTAMVRKQVIPPHLLPFANDWGGNFFCLNLNTGAISYFATDSFYSDVSPKENQAKAEQPICSDLTCFVQGLIDEDDIMVSK